MQTTPVKYEITEGAIQFNSNTFYKLMLEQFLNHRPMLKFKRHFLARGLLKVEQKSIDYTIFTYCNINLYRLLLGLQI